MNRTPIGAQLRLTLRLDMKSWWERLKFRWRAWHHLIMTLVPKHCTLSRRGDVVVVRGDFRPSQLIEFINHEVLHSLLFELGWCSKKPKSYEERKKLANRAYCAPDRMLKHPKMKFRCLGTC